MSEDNRMELVPSKAQIMELCAEYDIGELLTIQEIMRDTVNINIRFLTNKGRYVTKVFSDTPQRFDFIISTLEILKQNSVPVLIPLKNMNGLSYSVFVHKLLHVSEFVSGYPFISDRRQAYSSGLNLRRFHNTLSEKNDMVKPIYSLYPYPDVLKKGIQALEKIGDSFPEEWLYSINSLYCSIVEQWEVKCIGIPSTIIHGDWHQGNQLYDQLGKLCCIMDFDNMTRAERLFDVAYALWRFSVAGEPLSISRAFIDGYGGLTKEEVYLLPLELARINFFFLCSAGLSSNPRNEFPNQYSKRIHFIMWSLSKEGEIEINRLCK